MSRILGKLYFFTKLSTSILLFAIVILLIFLFLKSFFYQNFSYEEVLENKLKKVNKINNIQFQENNKLILNLSKQITNLEKDIEKLQKNNSENDNENLKKDIEKINKQISSISKNNQNKNITVENNQNKNIQNFIITKNLDTIIISVERGIEFTTLIKELETIIQKNSIKNYLKQLSSLSDGSVMSYYELKNNFDFNSNLYLKEYLFEKSGESFLVNFILNFFSLKPDEKSKSEDNTLRTLSIAEDYLNKKEISEAIKEINKIDKLASFFNEWVSEALKYEKCLKLIYFIKKDLSEL